MIYIIVILASLFFSALTFFSGFGLATVLTPIFILFFPAPIAISLVAVVHFLNNIFKFILTSKNINKEIILKFGSTGILGAVIGSFTLLAIAKSSFTISYNLFNHNFHVELVNFIVGILILFFAFLELLPQISKLSLNKNLLFLGGMLSGFFGGLSGHQGAFRSIFLIKYNLSKEQFVATGILSACLIDIVRISVYGVNFLDKVASENFYLLAAAVISAFAGSYIANRYMQKITIKLIQNIIMILLIVISAGLITGLIK